MSENIMPRNCEVVLTPHQMNLQDMNRFAPLQALNLHNEPEVITDQGFHGSHDHIGNGNDTPEIGSVVLVKPCKSYPHWLGKILYIHLNRNTCLVQFFQIHNWILVQMTKVQKYENLESY